MLCYSIRENQKFFLPLHETCDINQPLRKKHTKPNQPPSNSRAFLFFLSTKKPYPNHTDHWPEPFSNNMQFRLLQMWAALAAGSLPFLDGNAASVQCQYRSAHSSAPPGILHLPCPEAATATQPNPVAN